MTPGSASARRMTTDVVILGGGVTASAASLALSSRGLTSVVLERRTEPPPTAGESLSGAARPLLRHLGLWDAFVRQGHMENRLTRSLWGTVQPWTRPFLFEPHGSGWQIDRAAFEGLLAQAAMSRGACRVEGANARAAHRDREGWTIEVEAAGSLRVSSRFAIDATGCAAWLAASQGAGRSVEDRFEARIVVFDRRHGGPPTVEARPEGWWYSAPVPGGRRVLALFGDETKAWEESLRRTSEVRHHVPPGVEVGTVRVVLRPVEVSRSTRFGGDGWVAAGDAAFSYDPLSAHGLTAGLWGGALAGLSTAAHLAGETRALETYGATLEAAWQRDRRIRTAYYRLESRWPDAPFWSRRWGPEGARPDQRPASSLSKAGSPRRGSQRGSIFNNSTVTPVL